MEKNASTFMLTFSNATFHSHNWSVLRKLSLNKIFPKPRVPLETANSNPVHPPSLQIEMRKSTRRVSICHSLRKQTIDCQTDALKRFPFAPENKQTPSTRE